MIKIIFILVLLTLSQSLFAQDSLLFVIRVDDIQSRNTTIVPKSIKYFQQAVELRGGKVTWAVIPHRLIEAQNQDGSLLRDLKESVLTGHEVAMHGYNHICPSCSQSSHEMFCTTNNIHFAYTQQIQLINDGLEILFDSLSIVPKTFVPPGHKADTITYQVLIDKGFEWLSSNGGTKTFIYKTLYNLQQNNEFTWQLTSSQYTAKLNSALQEIHNTAGSNGYYCLLFHDYFIRQGYENGIVVNWIGELLDSLNNYYGNKIKYVTLGEAANIFREQRATSVEKNLLIPNKFVLHQNYPNPFNPTSTIKYDIPENSIVQIKVYDILGKEVVDLLNEDKSAGSYEVGFNASSLASGIYFYRIHAGSFIDTKKMILLK